MLRRRRSSGGFLDRLWGRLTGRFTTWPADDFARFTRSAPGGVGPASMAAQPPPAEPLRPPVPESLAPVTFEMRFTKLHQGHRFEDMWDLLAEDAQRSWGGRERFVAGMTRQASEFELLEASVGEVGMVAEWTDRRRNRTYRNVAEMTVRYRIRTALREVALDRQVHLVPAADGWRTLYYPVAG